MIFNRQFGHWKEETRMGVPVSAMSMDAAGVTMSAIESPQHTLYMAEMRSGTGVGFVYPSLLTWKGSAVVHDPKGHAWALTAGYRERELGHRVFRFEPASVDTRRMSAFNPLAEMRIRTEFEKGDIHQLAGLLIDPTGEHLHVDQWAKRAFATLVNVLTHICRKARDERKTPQPADVIDFLTARKWWKTVGPMVDCNGAVAGSPPDSTKSSIIGAMLSYLSIYRDPIVSANTGRSDWTMADLEDGDNPVTVYIVARREDAERMRRISSMVIQMIIRRLTSVLHRDGHPIVVRDPRFLLLLDEFPSLGRMPLVEEALAYMHRYGSKAILTAGGTEEIEAVYGKGEMVLSNCHVRVCGPGTSERTAKKLGIPEATQVHNPKRDPQGGIEGPGTLAVNVVGQGTTMAPQYLYFNDPILHERSKIAPPKLGN